MKDTLGVSHKPVVRLQLSASMLRQLIPAGSEIEAALIGGVVENYAKSISDRMLHILQQKHNSIVQDVIAQMTRSQTTWDRQPTVLMDATKEAAIRKEAETQIKSRIEQEVAVNLASYELSKSVSRIVEEKVKYFLREKDIINAVDEAIRARIQQQLTEMLPANFAAMVLKKD